MKGKVVKREVIHNLELTDKELNKLRDICKHFLNADGVIEQGDYDLCNDIINYSDSNNIGFASAISLEDDESDYDLLDNQAIYIMNNRLVREDIGDDEEHDVVAYIGKKDQLSLRTNSMIKPVFFNRECAILLRDFIDRLGEGTYRGVGSFNSNEYFELDLYLDNKGNAINRYSGKTKSLVQRYYYSLEGTPFGIFKDSEKEMRLNYCQAQLLSKFISRHF